MEYLTDLFLPVSISFQTSPDWLLSVMKAITFLGDTEFYLIIMPLLYWCVDAVLGIRIGIILLVSGGLNSILKFSFASPRPFWETNKVKALVEATGFGFPSGHAQNAASIWGLLASSTKRNWLRILSILLIILIGLSRIFLGVHFSHDVMVGWMVGLLILYLFLRLEDPVTNWFRKNSTITQILALIFITSLFIIIAFLIVNPLNPPTLAEEWHINAGETITPYNFDGLMTTTGAFFGLGLGVILLSKTGLLQTKTRIWKLVVRYFVGLIGVLALYLGLDSIFPDDISYLAFFLRFVRYAFIGLWISFGAPKVFKWIGLVD